MDDHQHAGRNEGATGPIALTGASGFVGRAVVEALRRQGSRILALGNPASAPELEGVDWVPVNLLDPPTVKATLAHHKPCALIHAAWARSEGAGLWNLEANWAWRDASAALLRAFWEETGGHVVACGTCAEYSPPPEGDCIEDVTPIAPASTYGKAKAELADRARKDAQALGGSIAWARLFYLFGKHEAPSRLVPQVIDRLLAGGIAEIGSGRAVRDFGYVSDIGAGLVALLNSGESGTFNVATGSGVSIASLVDRIGHALGKSDRIALGTLPDRPDEPPRIVADITRLKETTGWSPAFDVASGLSETINWRKRKGPATG
ncbi:NAD(P)-dependent oxidoreductase [Qipengyuania sp. G39]|uniref:NAD(P)-dependent oxidoreductase n=1 Tax=Qipengyuania profundimaris TaxID=3067652 RepID=A0ABT9HP56_9SPHN|nr:NAD(P)-dependent oxidoreductase [Qipengyuania sp. G39]MDP4574916.1 NAD(P)-dependent oxidoreductase [Qipengyuania sp. G39]